jgi:hypothetical protein
MFIMPNTQMNLMFRESQHPTSQLYGEEIKKVFNVEYNGQEIETIVEIKISYCKKEERERYGRNAGGEPFGKKYLFRNLIGTSGYHNISVVRAGREIDHGSFGFIRDVSDNRERWWSAEIIVEPIIDSIIGIDNKKQQAAEIKFIDNTESSTDTETHEIIKWISLWLSENIKQVKKIVDNQNATDSGVDSRTVTVSTGKLPPGGKTEAGDPVDLGHEIYDEEEKRIKSEFKDWIKERYPDIPEKEVIEMVNYALSLRDNHIFIKSDLGDTQLYSYKVIGTKVLIEINYSHSFYRRFMQPFEEDPQQEKSIRSIRLLIGAMVNSEIVNKTQDKAILKDRRNIRNRMSESLDDYIEDLYLS